MAEEIGIVLTLDGAREFLSNLLSAQEGLTTLGDFLTNAVAQLNTLDQAIKSKGGGELLKDTNFGELNAQLNQATTEVQQLYNQLNTTTAGFDANVTSAERLSQELKDLKSSADQATSDLNEAGNSARDTAGDFEKVGSAAQQAANETKSSFDGIGDAARQATEGFDTSSIDGATSQFDQIVKDLLEFADAYEYVGTTVKSQGNIWTNISSFFDTFQRVNTTDIANVGEALTGVIGFFTKLDGLTSLGDNLSQAKTFAPVLSSLGKGIAAFSKAIDGKETAANFKRSLAAFDSLGVIAQKLSEIDANVTVAGKDVVQGFAEFTSRLAVSIDLLVGTFKELGKIEPTETTAGMRSVVNSVKRIHELFSGDSLDADTFSADLVKVTTALREFAKATAAIGSSKNIAKFNAEVGSLIASLNRLANEVDAELFLETIKPYAAALRDLTASANALIKLGGKSFISKMQTQEIENTRLAAVKLRAETLRQNSIDVEKHILLREEVAKRKQAAKAIAAQVKAQNKANKAYANDTLLNSTRMLDRFISKLYEAESVSPEISIKLKVFGIQAFTTLVTFITKFPFKVVKTIISLFGSLGKVFAKIGFGAISAGVRLLGSALRSLGAIIASMLGTVIKLAVALLKLPFQIIGGAAKLLFNILSGLVTAFFRVIAAIGRMVVWAIKLIAKVTLITSLFHLMLIPIRLVYAAINALVGAFKRLSGSMGSTKSDQASQDMKELDAATDQATISQNALQVELSQTDRELVAATSSATKTTAAIAGMGVAASAINMARTFTTGKAIAKTIKSVLALTLAFKALQKAGQVISRVFQQVRFFMTGLIRDAVDASVEYEALILSLTALTKLEFKELGLDEQTGLKIAVDIDTKNALDKAKELSQTVSESLVSQDMRMEFDNIGESITTAFNSGNAMLGQELRAEADSFGSSITTSVSKITTAFNSGSAKLGQELRMEADSFGASITQAVPEVQSGLSAVQQSVQDTVQWIRALAIQSPFEEADVAELYRYGVGAGFSAEKMRELTQNVLDFGAGVAATPDQLKSTIRALGQMNNAVNLTKEDLNQLAETGFRKPAQALADALPAYDTMGEVLEAITAKQIDGAVAAEIFSQRMKADFAGSALQATKSLGGLISTMQSLRKTMLVEFSAPVFDILKPLVAGALGTEQISALLVQAKELGTLFAEFLLEATTRVVTVFGYLKAIFEAIPGPVKGMMKEFAKFVAITLATFAALALLKTAMMGAILVVGLFLNPLALAVAVLVGFGAAIVSAAKKFNTQLQGMRSAFMTWYEAVRPGVEAIYDVFYNTFSKVTTLIGTFVNTVFDYGLNIGISLANGILAAASAVVNAVMQVAGVIAVWLQPGSPPKALPYIDQWGTAAATEFADGFADGDLTGVITMSEEMADLINNMDFSATPSISGDTSLVTEADVTGLEKFDLLNDYLEETQDNVLATTKSFSAMLSSDLDIATMSANFVTLSAELDNVNSLMQTYGESVRESGSALSESASSDTFQDIITESSAIKQAMDQYGEALEGAGVNVEALISTHQHAQPVLSRTEQQLKNNADRRSARQATELAELGAYLDETLNHTSLLSRAYTVFSDNMSKAFARVGPTVSGALASAGSVLQTFVGKMFDYGLNIGTSLANGIIAAASAVVNAVMQIAGVIATWLQPGSPPKALPKIDQWGTAAANEFLGGFSSADFSMISDFGSVIGDLVESLELPEGSIDVNDLQQDLANLIDGLKNGLDATAIPEFFSEVQKEAGEFSADVENVANEFVALAREQAKLISLTDKYNMSLSSTNAELDELSRQETYAEQEKELASLDRKLASSAYTAEQKAQFELQRNKVLAQQRKTEIEGQQAAVDEQKDRIALLKERIGLDKELADGEGVGAAPGAGGGGAASALGKLKDVKLDDITDGLAEGLGGLVNPIENVQGALGDLEIPEMDFGKLIQDAKDKVDTKIKEIQASFEGLGVTLTTVKRIAFLTGAALLMPLVARNAGAIAVSFGKIGKVLAPFAVAGGLAAAAIILLGAAFVLFSDKITPELLTSISTGFKNLGTSFSTFATAFKDGLSELPEVEDLSFVSLVDFIGDAISTGDPATIGTAIGNVLGVFRTELLTRLTTAKDTIVASVKTNLIDPFINAFAITADPMFEDRSFIERIVDGITASLVTAKDTLVTAVNSFIQTSIVEPFQQGFGESGDPMFDTTSFGQRLLSGLVAVFTSITGPAIDAVTTFLTEIFGLDVAGFVQTLRDNIQTPITKAINDLTIDDAPIREKIIAALTAAIAGIKITLGEVFQLPEIDFAFVENIKSAFEGFKDAIPSEVIELLVFWWGRLQESFADSDLGPKILEMAVSLGELSAKIGVVVLGLIAFAGFLLGGVFVELPGILGGVIEAVTGVLEVFNGLFDAIIGFGIGAFTGDWTAFGDALTRITEGFGSFATGIGDVIAGVVSFFTNLIVGTAILQGFNPTEGFLEKMNTFKDTVGNTVAVVIGYLSTLGYAPFALAALFKGAFTLAQTALTNFGEGAGTSITNLKDLLTRIFDEIKLIFETKFANPFKSIVETMTNIATAGGPVEMLKTALSELVSFVLEITFEDPFAILTGFINLFLPFIGLIDDEFTILQTFINTWTTNNPFSPLTTVINTFKSLVLTIKEPFNNIKAFLEGLVFNIPGLGTTRDAVNGFIDSLPFGGDGGVDIDTTGAFDDLERDLSNETVEATPTLDVELDTTEAEASIKASSETLGEEVPAGIAVGIETGSKDLRTSVENTADNAISWIESKLGISSPSTVARDEIGVEVAAGIIEGIDEGLSDSDATDTIALSFIETLQQSIQNAFVGIDLFGAALGGSTEGAAESTSGLLAIDPDSIQAFIQSFSATYIAVIELLEAFVEEYLEMYEEFVVALQEMIDEYNKELVKATKDLYAELVELLVTFTFQVITILNAFLDKVKSVMKKFATIMRDAARDAVDAFLDELGKLSDAAIAILDAMLVTLEDDLGPKFTELGYNLGAFFAQGIIDALADYEDELIAAGVAAGKAVKSGTEQELDLGSPSKEAYKIGVFYVQGLVNGIADNVESARAVGAKIADKVSSATNKVGKDLRLAPLTVPINTEYLGLRNSLPDLQQNVRLNAGGQNQGIATMRGMSSANITTYNNNYALNMTVRESQAPRVSKAFSKMQSLRI